jgi:hypothetical protein
MSPPYNTLLNKLLADDFHGAIAEWRAYCQSGGNCSHGGTANNVFPFIFCANMLEASIIGKSLGGEGPEKELFFSQAQKLKKWISKQQ